MNSRQNKHCFSFQRGHCSYGVNCKYLHDRTPQTEAQDSSRKIDKRKSITQGNDRGKPFLFPQDNSKEQTPLAAPKTSAAFHGDRNPQGELWAWIRMVPESNSTTRPLGRKLPRFFQLAWSLVSEREVGTQQRVITKLASEGGLQRIKELTDTEFKDFSDDQRVAILKKSVLPFFQTIAHEDTLFSLLLENAVYTIYNFLFGPSGRRAIRLYTYIVHTLPVIYGIDGDYISALVRASLVVLHKIVELNGTALILEEFHHIVEMISGYLGEDNVITDVPSVQEARQILRRIQCRLNLGSMIPSVQIRLGRDAKAPESLKILQDMPGLLSAEGPRHDNDHEDITNIKIMPTTQEIQSGRLEYLPVRDPAALHLPGVKGLLDRQFRLLREDTIGQLRDAVKLEIERLCRLKQSRPASAGLKHTARTIVYHDVRLVDIKFDKWKGLLVVAEFDQPNALQKMTTSQRRDWWAHSKQLQIDSLICLVDSEGGTIFLSVAEQIKTTKPAADDLMENIEHKKVESGVSESLSEPRDLSSNPHRAALVLRLVDTYVLDIAQTIHQFTTGHCSRQSLVEFPGVLLPSFRPTLQALQQMSRHVELPFAEFLVPPLGQEGKAHIPPPSYALHEGFTFDLSCVLTDGRQLTLSPKEQFDFEALRQGSNLDEAQGLALVDALSRSLALIQGPPGTGKSFTGVALIKILLKNRDEAHLGPIICVCYTNHALDQLLEHLVADHIKHIIRLGSRSKSQMLEPLNLRQVSQGVDKTKIEKHTEWELRGELDLSSLEIEGLLLDMKNANSWRSIKTYLETDQPQHHNELFGDDEDGFQTVHHDLGRIVDNWLRCKPIVKNRQARKVRSVQTLVNVSLWKMNQEERQALYQYWIIEIRDTICNNLCRALNSYTETKDRLNQCRQELDLRCLQEAHVIGVTTTGLAKNINILRRLRSKVMICEEAGEVLEAHIITALLPQIEHAILIGDHQQLRPQIQNYDLQHESPSGKKYSLDVSLFERLVEPQESWGIQVPVSVLEIQRRMHPSIAQLVRDTLYKKLQDHESVNDYPEVFGLGKRLFWLDHKEPEADTDPFRVTSTSHSNNHEVEMTAALVSHLCRQGKYQKDDIAVITPYLGQLHKLRTRMAGSHEVVISDRDAEELENEGFDVDVDHLSKPSTLQKTTLLEAVRIATVDNFQGEEAKVVIISLVRSNLRNRCGFLKTSNRINVLLSRARHGMYIIGNAQTSCHVPMWAEVLSILKRNNNIGQTLPLRCSRHRETVIEVSTPDDFSRFAPEGGCNKKCKIRLPCGHSCINKCHSEPLHNAVICLKPCSRSKSGCDHSCPRPCGQECDQVCHAKVTNVTLLCGHVKAHLECYKAQNLSTVCCKRQVERNVPGCNHIIKIPCYMDVTAENFQCDATCGETLPCGHACLQKCHSCNPRKGSQSVERIHSVCQSQCGRPYNNCPHRCMRQCHGEEACPLCESPCEVQCGHSICGKKCQEPCVPCAQECSWSCPHSGRCQMPCAVPCDILPCSERCQETLNCGHRCPSICGEKCPTSEYCQICASEPVKDALVDYILQTTYDNVDLDEDPIVVPSCGHIMTLSSMDGHMRMSDYYELSQSNFVKAPKALPEPFSVVNLKSCPMCRGPLREINRYNRIVRQGLVEQATKKFISWANQQYIPLEQRLYEEEKRLQQSAITEESFTQKQGGERYDQTLSTTYHMRLEKSPSYQIDTIRKFPGLKIRYKSTAALKVDISKFLRQVCEEEQPFGRVFDMVQDVRRRRGVRADMTINRNFLNTRNRMLATVLSIRCDLAILSDFIALRQKGQELSTQYDWVKADLHVDLSRNRQACENLICEAITRDQPMHEVEARVFFVRWSILERSIISSDLERSKTLLAEAKDQLSLAEETCKQHPGQTRGMLTEVLDVSRMLRDTTFYATVDNEEKRQIYAAMAREFTGTGHWYTCANGHPFTIGECGMPMQTSVCPQCGAPVGGQDHQPIAGVTHARDFEAQFGGLPLY